jgi:hypothetical protein
VHDAIRSCRRATTGNSGMCHRQTPEGPAMRGTALIPIRQQKRPREFF